MAFRPKVRFAKFEMAFLPEMAFLARDGFSTRDGFLARDDFGTIDKRMLSQ